jgi:2-polyprenyl-6-methoxyphenol hydroxylase-like FAD-dependent oxidoreductase
VSAPLGKHAIVVGAGLAGLASARAVSARFERVTLLHRDVLPSIAAHRSGTPQDQHTHAILVGGLQALEDLFPGFGADLAAAGAVPYRVNLDVRFEREGFDPLPQRDFGWDAYAMTRPPGRV